jgi:hypothetical protein
MALAFMTSAAVLAAGVFGLAFVVEIVIGYNLFMHKTQP